MRCSDAGCWRSAMKKSARPGSGECWRQPAHLSSACITCGPANATKNSKQVRFGCARESLKLSSGAAEPGACFIRHGRVERRGISDRSAGGLRMRARAGDSAPQKVVLGRPDEKVRRRRAHESTAVPVNQKRGKAPEPELEEPRCFSVE
jgi:hypothetical protein